MTTDLTVVSQELLDALANDMGAGQEDLNGGGGSFLPQLKVWSDEDLDDEDAPRRKGRLYITNQDVLVFAKPNTPVTFRPLTHTFQWTQYDTVAKALVNKTRLVYNFKEEARDEKGTIKCGKPPSKDLKDNKALQEKYKDVTTYRRLQGYVSYTGIDEEGNEVSVDNVLVAINSKGASFSAFDEEFIKKMPDKSKIWDFNTNISLSKEKNGSVVYWVMHYEPDFATKLPMTMPIFNVVAELKAKIDATNKAIDTKYYQALDAKNGDDAALEALKTVGTGRPGKFTSSNLGEGMDDDIPF